MNKLKKASLVIVNYMGDDDTLNFIKSIRKTDYPDYEIIVVDNGSMPGFESALPKNVKYVKTGKNLGYGGGINAGIKHAKGEYIVFLNNDMLVFERHWLRELVEVAESDKKIGIARVLAMQSKNPELIETNIHVFKTKFGIRRRYYVGKGEKDVGQFPRIMEADWGGSGLIKREVIEKIGFFDEKFFLYFEEADFCRRARRAGYRTVLATRSKLIHKHGASTKKMDRWFMKFIFYRSKLRYTLKGFGIVK